MQEGGYVIGKFGVPVYVGDNVPVWKQEVDQFGNPIQRSGSPDGGCLGKLIVGIITIVLGVIAIIATLLGALGLQLYVRIFEPNDKPLSYTNCLQVMFKPLFVYQIVWFVCGLMLLGLYKIDLAPSFLDPFLRQNNAYLSFIMASLVSQVPAILISGSVLCNRLAYFDSFKRFGGYLRATILVILSLVCSFLLTALALKIVSTYNPQFHEQFMEILNEFSFPEI
jgi:uncharacterized membrane protein